jgi:hypothetical protein
MEVTEQGQLDLEQPIHPVLKAVAIFFSYLLHPLLLIGWLSLYLLYINQNVFLGIDPSARILVFLRIFGTAIFLPIVTVLLLKGLGFIQSIQLNTQKERIIPFVACITFFFWSYYVSKQLGDPGELKAFLLTLFVSSCAALIINNYFKISIHTMAAGTIACFFLLLLFNHKIDSGLTLFVVFLLTGISGTSRLLTKNHHPFEIYSGYIMGFLLQLVCWWIAY